MQQQSVDLAISTRDVLCNLGYGVEEEKLNLPGLLLMAGEVAAVVGACGLVNWLM